MRLLSPSKYRRRCAKHFASYRASTSPYAPRSMARNCVAPTPSAPLRSKTGYRSRSSAFPMDCSPVGLISSLKPGQFIDCMEPAGHFHVALEPASARHHVAFAVGSGITPVISILKTTLATEPRSHMTLVYGNRCFHLHSFSRRTCRSQRSLHCPLQSRSHSQPRASGHRSLHRPHRPR